MESKLYWKSDMDNILFEYIAMEDELKRSILFKEEIYPAFSKLVECVFNVGKYRWIYSKDRTPITDEEVKHSRMNAIPYNEIKADILHDAVGHLVLQIPKYCNAKGKSFCYFNIIARNYFILLNQRANKEYVNNLHFSTWELHNDANDQREIEVVPLPKELIVVQNHDEPVSIANVWDTGRRKLRMKRDIKNADIIHSILSKFETGEIELPTHKKGVYDVFRKHTNMATQAITTMINRMQITPEKLT